MNSYAIIASVFALAALIVAFALTKWIGSVDEGTDRMKEIAGFIREGAMAFLSREYKIMAIVIVVLFLLIGFGLGNWITAVLYVLGALLQCLRLFRNECCYKRQCKNGNAARESGMSKALKVAFRSGAVMGLCVTGLGLLGLGVIFVALGVDCADVITGFGLGASSMALFGRVGGGIYTKAADVGADLVGKVEAGIPEDDPRNPAVIADNVGDNVGDVAGMGSDLFESYVGSIISAITLAVIIPTVVPAIGAEFALDPLMGSLFPLLLAAVGIIASIIGIMFVRGSENVNPATQLNIGTYISGVIVIVASVVLSKTLLGTYNCAVAIIAGL